MARSCVGGVRKESVCVFGVRGNACVRGMVYVTKPGVCVVCSVMCGVA